MTRNGPVSHGKFCVKTFKAVNISLSQRLHKCSCAFSSAQQNTRSSSSGSSLLSCFDPSSPPVCTVAVSLSRTPPIHLYYALQTYVTSFSKSYTVVISNSLHTQWWVAPSIPRTHSLHCSFRRKVNCPCGQESLYITFKLRLLKMFVSKHKIFQWVCQECIVNQYCHLQVKTDKAEIWALVYTGHTADGKKGFTICIIIYIYIKNINK